MLPRREISINCFGSDVMEKKETKPDYVRCLSQSDTGWQYSHNDIWSCPTGDNLDKKVAFKEGKRET